MWRLIIIFIILIIIILYTIKHSRYHSGYSGGSEPNKETNPISDSRVEQVISSNGNRYKVYIGYPNPKRAADILDILCNNINKLVIKLRHKACTKNEQEIVDSISYNFNSDNVVETYPDNNKNDTSYVNNKGRNDGILSICLRKDDYSFHTINELMFVIIHEISHIGTKVYGHDVNFQKNFKWLLEQSEQIGIYTPIDYSVTGFKYCKRVDVSTNPYFNNSLPKP